MRNLCLHFNYIKAGENFACQSLPSTFRARPPERQKGEKLVNRRMVDWRSLSSRRSRTRRHRKRLRTFLVCSSAGAAEQPANSVSHAGAGAAGPLGGLSAASFRQDGLAKRRSPRHPIQRWSTFRQKWAHQGQRLHKQIPASPAKCCRSSSTCFSEAQTKWIRAMSHEIAARDRNGAQKFVSCGKEEGGIL